MGNSLCGHATKGTQQHRCSHDASTQLPNKRPQLVKQNSNNSINSTLSLIAASAGNLADDSPAGSCADDVELTLRAARAELDSSLQKSFYDDYICGKIVGHGAYCKVQVCTHNQTGQECAVKAVIKNADLKQREGAHLCIWVLLGA
jgi:hypothetical protein